MPVLNTATALYVGSTVVQKVYHGTIQVWPPEAQGTTE